MKNWYFILLILYSFSLKGQYDPELGYDTSYIVSFRDYLVVTLPAEHKTNSILYQNKEGETLDYATNSTYVWGIGLDYKWLTFEYTTKLPWSEQDPKMGETANSSLGFGFTMRKFWFRNFFEFNRGFYLENTGYWIPEFVDQEYYLRPDIFSFTYYANLNYGFNHKKFSNTASMWQLERQRKTAGSFTAGATYSLSLVASDSGLVPSKVTQQFENNILEIAFTNLGLNLGYLVNIPLSRSKKWFTTLALIPGISAQNTDVYDIFGTKYSKRGELGVTVESRLGLGYNGDRWYSGLIIRNYSIANYFNSESPITVDYNYLRIYLGYKIKLPETKSKFLKKLGL